MLHTFADELDAFEDESQRAYRKILRMASAREISSASARQKLVRDGFSGEAVSSSIQRALDNRIIDDIRYADALVRSKLAAGKGLTGVQRELEELGVDIRSLDSFQEHEELGEEHEVERAIEVLNRRSITAKNKRDAAYRRLIQAGFSSSIASQAASEWLRGNCY